MKKAFFSSLFLLMSILTLQAQSPRVQVIHNCADAAADTVDIWINGSKAVDNLAFREATGYVTLNSGATAVGIAGKNSTTINDTLANFDFNLVMGATYTIVADGILSGSGYSPAQPFNLNVFGISRETANNAGEVDILVHHGSTDAPTVDVRGQNPAALLVDDAPYGGSVGYLSLLEDDYIIRITDATGSTIVQSYEAPLAALNLAGQSIVVVASGFLNPANNSNGPAFGLYVALATGGPLVALPVAANPRVQVIHNSPDAGASTVDLWVNGTTLVDDVAFRTATGFISLNTGMNTVGVAGGTSTSANDTIANFDLDLLAGNTYIVVADGTLSGTGYSPFQPFGLNVYTMGREAAMNADKVDVLVHHGSTDAPTVDVRGADTTTVLVDDASYGAFAGYLELDTLDYVIRITDATGGTVVQSYTAPLDALNLGGAAITVVASGFLTPANNSNGPEFGLWVALASGGALVELPVATVSSIGRLETAVSEFTVFPNPAQDQMNLNITLEDRSDITLQWYNLQGQLIQSRQMGNLDAGQHSLTSDISNLSNGWYTLAIISDQGVSSAKVQVRK